MKLTKPTLAKVRYLLRNPSFRAYPIRTIYRIIHWEIVRILNRHIVFQYDNSIHIRLYPNDGVARLIYYFDYHEPEIFGFLNKYLREGMTFIDVGANIGAYTLFAAKRVGAKGKVFAFEPQRETFKRLIDNIYVNGFTNVIAEPFAVGKMKRKIKIVIEPDTAKSYVRINGIGDDDITRRQENCDMISLDKYFICREVNKVDYLKIDVEGFEHNVLKGGENFIRAIGPSIIQLELIDEFQRRSMTSVSMVEELLNILGYYFFKLNSVSTKLVKLRLGKEKPIGDIFLIHRNKLSKFQDLIQ